MKSFFIEGTRTNVSCMEYSTILIFLGNGTVPSCVNLSRQRGFVYFKFYSRDKLNKGYIAQTGFVLIKVVLHHAILFSDFDALSLTLLAHTDEKSSQNRLIFEHGNV